MSKFSHNIIFKKFLIMIDISVKINRIQENNLVFQSLFSFPINRSFNILCPLKSISRQRLQLKTM